jgi:hypothetical protein
MVWFRMAYFFECWESYLNTKKGVLYEPEGSFDCCNHGYERKRG